MYETPQPRQPLNPKTIISKHKHPAPYPSSIHLHCIFPCFYFVIYHLYCCTSCCCVTSVLVSAMEEWADLLWCVFVAVPDPESRFSTCLPLPTIYQREKGPYKALRGGQYIVQPVKALQDWLTYSFKIVSCYGLVTTVLYYYYYKHEVFIVSMRLTELILIDWIYPK